MKKGMRLRLYLASALSWSVGFLLGSYHGATPLVMVSIVSFALIMVHLLFHQGWEEKI